MNNEKIKEFDDETRRDHYHLSADDDCYYFVEFIKGAGYGPPGNSFIKNLKKKPSKRGTYEWGHKLRAINDAAETLRRDLRTEPQPEQGGDKGWERRAPKRSFIAI